MIHLNATGVSYSQAAVRAGPSVVRVTEDRNRPLPLRKFEAFLVRDTAPPAGFGWHLYMDGRAIECSNAAASLPPALSYLADGDVVRLIPDRKAVRVLYRKSSTNNSFLLTERCNNYCLMCSQPPRNVDDAWIVDEILQVLPLIDPETREIGFTGGEPTLLGGRFFELVRAFESYLPRTSLHVLSNGRTFCDERSAAALAAANHHDLMVGIPIYSDIPHIHDYVVQADGAFDETIRGILNLRRHRQRVEIRIVMHKQTYQRLPQLAEFITRNLLFADHVALMGLELMGFARANFDDLWMSPRDYTDELRRAVGTLSRARMNVSVYNLQHCLMDRSVWPYAKRSISDWKNEYVAECQKCTVREGCAGMFTSSTTAYGELLSAVL